MSGKSRPNDDDLPARGTFFSKPVDERLLRQAPRNIETNQEAARWRAADGSCRSPNGAGTKASVGGLKVVTAPAEKQARSDV